MMAHAFCSGGARTTGPLQVGNVLFEFQFLFLSHLIAGAKLTKHMSQITVEFASPHLIRNHRALAHFERLLQGQDIRSLQLASLFTFLKLQLQTRQQALQEHLLLLEICDLKLGLVSPC